MNELTPASLSRRAFLKKGAKVTGAFVVAFYFPVGFNKVFAQAMPPGEYPPNAFIKIAPDNTITIIINKLEMGQGVYTSMAQLIAEELECDWTKIRSESAPVDAVYNNPIMGIQLTGGSSALISTYDQYRKIGAGMREMLVGAAAKKWGVKPDTCRAENGFVVHATKGKVAYGDLAAEASKQPIPKDVKLKPAKEFKVIGKSTTRVDALEKSTGKAVFGMDVRLKGMLYACIARPPIVGAELSGVKDKVAKSVKGVVDVVRFNNSIAVLAKNTWAAKSGRDALELTWDLKGLNTVSSASLMEEFRGEASKPGVSFENRGDAAAGLKKAAKKITAEYEFPYLAHACMEPLNCTIDFNGKKAEIWAGHQMPGIDREVAAKILGIPSEKVEVHTLYAGGSFGRRASKTSDWVVEAAWLAKKIKKPFKIVWTREDDMKGGYYRPMTYHKVEVGFDAKKKLTGWNHRIVGQSVVAGSPMEAMMIKGGIDPTVVEGVGKTHYDLPHFAADLHMPKPNVTTLWWRSVGHTHTAYVMETMIDEVATHAKKDALAFRRELLKKSPRHVAVLDLLKKKLGWGKKAPKGRAYGIAIHESFNSVVGNVVEVSVKDKEVRVHKVVSAVHCGQVVNPEGAKAQVEGAIVYGLSAALYGEIAIEKGEITTSNFHDYEVVRLKDMPVVEVHFVPSEDHPTGLGEPGLPPLAPAVANAIFKLTGKRMRKLPFRKELA